MVTSQAGRCEMAFLLATPRPAEGLVHARSSVPADASTPNMGPDTRQRQQVTFLGGNAESAFGTKPSELRYMGREAHPCHCFAMGPWINLTHLYLGFLSKTDNFFAAHPHQGHQNEK